jgi:succinate dehydrogenase/fumarate reductase cytochrome b subunit
MIPASIKLVRIQALSGVAFALFLSVHLANTAAAIVSAGSYDAFQGVARHFYQQVVVEIVLVAGALLVHIAASLEIARRRKHGRAPTELRLHRYSGYFLLAVVFVHAMATRGAALFQGVHVAAQYLGFTLLTWPLIFFPYYALLFAAGACHLLIGLRLALGRLGLRSVTTIKPWAIRTALVATLGLGLLGLAALGGIVRPLHISERSAYERYFEGFLPPAVLPWRGTDRR